MSNGAGLEAGAYDRYSLGTLNFLHVRVRSEEREWEWIWGIFGSPWPWSWALSLSPPRVRVGCGACYIPFHPLGPVARSVLNPSIHTLPFFLHRPFIFANEREQNPFWGSLFGRSGEGNISLSAVCALLWRRGGDRFSLPDLDFSIFHLSMYQLFPVFQNNNCSLVQKKIDADSSRRLQFSV
jgi:hypothetical protein